MSRPSDRLLRFALNALLALPLAGCGASLGAYVPVAQLPPPAAAAQTIEPGDLVSVHVWNAERMETRQRVLDDGTVSLFFLDRVTVAGKTTAEVAADVAARIGDVVKSPQVNVVIEEVAGHTLSVIGEVQRPGAVSVLRAPGVLDALAAAGGLTPFAHRDRIFVLRQRPEPLRVRVRYEELVRGDHAAIGFRLRAGDVVVVE